MVNRDGIWVNRGLICINREVCRLLRTRLSPYLLLPGRREVRLF